MAGMQRLIARVDRPVERLRGGRAHDQEIDLALDQVLDVSRLLGRVVVGVSDDQLLDLVG